MSEIAIKDTVNSGLTKQEISDKVLMMMRIRQNLRKYKRGNYITGGKMRQKQKLEIVSAVCE